MGHLRAVLVKTLAIHAALRRVVPRLAPRVRRRDLFLVSLALALTGYVADLLALPRQGSRRTAAADAGLAVLVLSLGRRLLPGLRLGLPALLAGAAAVALEELWLHDALAPGRPRPDGVRHPVRQPAESPARPR